MTFDHPLSWFYSDIIKDPPLNVGGKFDSHYLLRLSKALCIFLQKPCSFSYATIYIQLLEDIFYKKDTIFNFKISDKSR